MTKKTKTPPKSAMTHATKPLPPEPASAQFVEGVGPLAGAGADGEDVPLKKGKIKRSRYSVYLQPEIRERLFRYWAAQPASERKTLSELAEKMVIEGLDARKG
jgi:hypothetical protein